MTVLLFYSGSHTYHTCLHWMYLCVKSSTKCYNGVQQAVLADQFGYKAELPVSCYSTLVLLPKYYQLIELLWKIIFLVLGLVKVFCQKKKTLLFCVFIYLAIVLKITAAV